MKKLLSFLSVLVLTFSVVTGAQAAAYNIDHTHSTMGFSVSHLVVSQTTGEFTDYKGSIKFDPNNIEATDIDVTIQAKSIDTGVADRDAHLRNSDFFDIENHPTLTFKSKAVKKAGDGYTIVGDLTILGVTKEISLIGGIAGPIESPFGSTVIGIAAETTIDRRDFGMTWNKNLDSGGVVVGDLVKLQINVEAHKK